MAVFEAEDGEVAFSDLLRLKPITMIDLVLIERL